MKDWLKSFLAGIGIGVGSAVPGVSGGTIAVILKVYEKLVWSISNLFKEFKKAVIYLLPILIGVILALIPTIYLMHKALNGFVFGIVCVFAGFIIGSFPSIKDEVKGQKINKFHVITLIISLLIALSLGITSALVSPDVTGMLTSPKWWVYLLLIPIGIIASVALVVPGISGSMILLLIGFYRPLIDTTIDKVKSGINGNWSGIGEQIAILGCFAIGIIIGFYFISKIMNYLLIKHRLITFYAIIGFIIGSTIALFFNHEIFEYYKMWANGQYISVPYYYEIPLGVLLLVICCALAYILVIYQRKSKKDE